MTSQGFWDDNSWHDSKHAYTFPKGTIIEFKSIDKFGKAHGPRRDVLFLNEANNIDYQIADQLITRTRDIVWMDWNPSTEFWFYTEMNGKREDIDFITLTYLDNEALDENTLGEIMAHKNNKGWWTVYALGQLGEVEGLVYKGWQVIDTVPHEARITRTGLDFGYTNDESAIVDIYYLNGGYILDEVLYRKGMTNKQLVDTLQYKEQQALVVADSAEPKSIDELKAYGINVLPASKGKGSVYRGIDYVRSQRISVTRHSANILKEYRNYLFLVDKDGKITNEEDPACKNHSMSAIRYALDSLRPNEQAVLTKLNTHFQRNEANFAGSSTR